MNNQLIESSHKLNFIFLLDVVIYADALFLFLTKTDTSNITPPLDQLIVLVAAALTLHQGGGGNLLFVIQQEGVWHA